MVFFTVHFHLVECIEERGNNTEWTLKRFLCGVFYAVMRESPQVSFKMAAGRVRTLVSRAVQAFQNSLVVATDLDPVQRLMIQNPLSLLGYNASSFIVTNCT